jgi:hypothetical protein
MTFRPRHNLLDSQRVSVALVYKEMLGIDEAMAYLRRENVCESIAERILLTGRRRHVLDTTSHPAPSPTQVGCRRRNHVQAAMIEASLAIEGKLGADWARTLLNNENIPNEVAERIFAQGPRQLRAKA